MEAHNNSLQLPELKSITPQISNVKNYYDQMNGGSQSYNLKMMNRK